ncbi:MAG: DUF2911 domain-containing protein [Planctomycetes bacterium]|nr:DUF2911 domain-containing protein [Planctomycetota bacterium]
MSVLSLVRTALVTAALAVPAFGQVQAFGGDAPRAAATRMLFGPNFTPQGMLCIQYGAPGWKAEYDAQFDQIKGQNLRLGKDFWTTFNTSCALTIGGVEVAAGAYYLGLKCDAEGKFSLLLLDAKTADAGKQAPWTGATWTPAYTCPLTKTATETEAAVMKMSLAGNGQVAHEMTFTLNWGKHQLAAPIVAKIAAT